MLQIWGRLTSLNVRKVVWAAQELRVPFERIDAGMQHGVVDTPEYRRMNPNGLVPVIVDEGFQLWESNAIVRYLGAKHSLGRFYPEYLRERFDAERWMDWQQTTLNPAAREAFVQLIRTPPDARNAAAIEASVAATAPLLARLDEQLARRPYLAGTRLTIADVPIACEVHRWWGLPLERQPYPHVERWYNGLLERPASRGVFDVPLA